VCEAIWRHSRGRIKETDHASGQKSDSASLASAGPPGDRQQPEGKTIMHDVQPDLYPTVIREMNRHENDVTNHRLMWLLLFQGLIVNAYGVGSVAEEGRG
jgi:hypothetical protein